MRAEQLTDPVAFHAEGPVWSAGWGGLRWVDMLAGDVLALAADGAISRRHVGSVVAALRPRAGGGAVIAVERGFALQDADGTLQALPELWSDDGVRMNEGGCDPQGRFLCGSMAYDEHTGAGTLHRLHPDGRVDVVLEDVSISNGLEWSPDGSLAYYVDTPTLRVTAFAQRDDGGGFGEAHTLVEIEDGVGVPDGLTVDVEGGIWVALNGGGMVRRYTAAGELDAVVEVPVAGVTACTLGGPGLDELLITTSRQGLQPGEDPAAGSLFRAPVGVAGRPVRAFAG